MRDLDSAGSTCEGRAAEGREWVLEGGKVLSIVSEDYHAEHSASFVGAAPSFHFTHLHISNIIE